MADFTFLSSDLVKVLSKKYLQVVHRIKNIFSSFICYSRYYLLWKHHKTELRRTQATPVLRMREKVPTVNKVTLSHLGHSALFSPMNPWRTVYSKVSWPDHTSFETSPVSHGSLYFSEHDSLLGSATLEIII